MSRKRLATLVLAVITAALAVTACGSSDSTTSSTASGGSTEAASSSGDGTKVGVVMKTFAVSVWQGVADGAEEKAEELGVDLLSQAGKTEQDIQGQISIVENMLTQGVEALVVSPNGTGQLAPILNRATDEGVKVVLVDTEVPGVEPVSFVQTDNKTMSEKESELFVEELGGKGEAGILTFPQISPVELRVEGTKNAIAGSEIDVVAELAGDCVRAKALNATTDMLEANPGISAIFAECGGNAGGAVRGVETSGLVPGKDVKVLGFDCVPEELELIKAGKEFASVWQDFPGIGAKATEIAVQAVEGKEFPDQVYVPAVVVTKENADEFEAQGESVVRKG